MPITVMSPRERRVTIALIDSAYAALHTLNNHTWTRYRDAAFSMAKAEEKDHRRSFGFRPYPVSVDACARLFVVKRIAEALIGTDPLTIKNVLSCQPSAIYCASIAANYEAECRAALEPIGLETLASLDYASFVATEA